MIRIFGTADWKEQLVITSHSDWVMAIAWSDDGSKLYFTWNVAHEIADADEKVPFRSVAMTVIHIPETERQP